MIERIRPAAFGDLAAERFSKDMVAVWSAVQRAKTPLVITHANPDADAISSILAVRDALTARGVPTVALAGDGELPEALEFLPGADRLGQPTEIVAEDHDLIIVVDCADVSRIGPLYEQQPELFAGLTPIVNVDHHVTNTRFGQINLVDAKAAATCEILTMLFLELEVPFDQDVATCLASGVHGDTLGLKTPSTTSRTLRIMGDLLDRGADHDTIIDNLFRVKPFSTVKLWGYALERATYNGLFAWTEVTTDMLERAGARSSEGEGIVNFITGTKGAWVGILFYHLPTHWRVSIRSISSDIDVAKIAAGFGGGGHSRAAGCSLPPGEESRQAFLDAVQHHITEAIGVEADNPR